MDTILVLSLHLPCSASPVSPRKELIFLSGALMYTTVVQGTLQDCLTLGASRAHACGPMGYTGILLKAAA